MPRNVRITDVSPRDGLQNEPAVVPARNKIRLVRLLAGCGLDEIEATSFVSPKWVPQLADAEEVLAALSPWPPPDAPTSRPPPLLSVLVPNEQGFERALAAHTAERPLKIALFTAASETFNRRNTNAGIAESVERFRPIIPRALAAGMPVRLYISCAIACPFEGPIAPDAVRRVADALLALAPDDDARTRLELDLADTIGVARPRDIEALLALFTPAESAPLLTLHLHDTTGHAAECVRAALHMGARSFDGAAGGLGGCPYASTPQRRAPGNIDTALLVRTVREAGFSTGADEDALARAAEYARSLITPA